MKTLSISEFEQYCKDNDIKWYIFSNKNQSVPMYPLGISIRFSSLYIRLQPNMIMLKGNNKDRVFFERVRCVRLSENNGGVRKKFNIICLDGEGKEVSYTVLGE